jgi:hypothetical protein
MAIKKVRKVYIRVMKVPESVLNMPRALRWGGDGTQTVIEKAIRSRRVYRVKLIEQDGRVWIDTYRVAGGRRVYNSIAIERDCIRVVRNVGA